MRDEQMRRTDRPWLKVPSAVGTRTAWKPGRARGTPCAFEGADERLVVGGEVAIAAFAVRSDLQHLTAPGLGFRQWSAPIPPRRFTGVEQRTGQKSQECGRVLRRIGDVALFRIGGDPVPPVLNARENCRCAHEPVAMIAVGCRGQ